MRTNATIMPSMMTISGTPIPIPILAPFDSVLLSSFGLAVEDCVVPVKLEEVCIVVGEFNGVLKVAFAWPPDLEIVVVEL